MDGFVEKSTARVEKAELMRKKSKGTKSCIIQILAVII